MEKTQGRTPILHRVIAILLAFVLVAGYFPTTSGWKVSAAEPGAIDTVADPETLTRPTTIYGSNTLNAGKVTVGKSVATHEDTVKLGNNDQFSFTAEENNFIVTISQFAQVMGLTSETTVPVDVVFVLDTSGSMGKNNTNNKTGRAEAMVNAANSAIATLLSVNEHNRVAVVAFSSEGYGSGTSNDNAANLLSPLYHYTGNSATKHLQWVNSSKTAYTGSTTNTTSTSFGVGSNYNLIAGRNQQGNANGTRDGGNGGTNIQAGIALGAQQLTSVTDTTVTYEDGTTVTRMPFIVLLSDGAPTFSSSIETWYNPSQTAEQGPGSSSYAGNGFLTALTAAYYKGAVTEHYYGSSADSNNRCSIYTIGVQLNSQSNSNDVDLAQLTMDPTRYLSDTTNVFADDFHSYWDSFADGETFMVRVDAGTIENYYNGSLNDLVWIGEGEPGSGAPNRSDYSSTNRYNQAYNEWRAANYAKKSAFYTVTANTIAHAKNYVTGKTAQGATMYTGDVAYNDGYYNADQTSEIAAIFQDVVNEIQMKAISSPTQVSTAGANFSGYVTFTDPIGEYMEVKDMKGIVAGGKFYQGTTAAQYLQSGSHAVLEEVLSTRMSMSNSTAVTVDQLLATADGNSITWWGKSYNVANNEKGMQVVGAAYGDSVEYITAATTVIPEAADHVCRSYFFCADNANEYLYFVVRVQRSLNAPYQQTVVISAPASLLSMEKVLVTEQPDGTYTAAVTESAPARVVYEVGLRSDITAENVSLIVEDDYKNKTVSGNGSVNHDAATDTYHFFTNDWDRTKDGSEHHRAMAKATFDAAADNAFYVYQADTLIVDASGKAVTSNPKGKTAYYVREYYDWAGASANVNGEFVATKKTQLIKIEIPSNTTLKEIDGKWYIPAGSYTAATLETIGDDIVKDDPTTAAENDGNKTGTAFIVSHAHRTGDQHNSHYTVLLGNNGKLSLKANTPAPEKTVHVNDSITDDNGKEVKVDDELTYEINVENTLNKQAVYTITDKVPAGTVFVSADNGGTQANGTVTWNVNIPANSSKMVKMTVRVTKDALSTNVVPSTIKNTAVVTFPNDAKYTTNPVENPPYGKVATDQNLNDTAGRPGYQVGNEITFHIRYHNNETNSNGEYVAANVTIVDKVPAGTELVAGTISHGGTVAPDGTITWNLTNVQPNMAGVVSFRVKIVASVGDTVNNQSSITVGNNPTVTTNSTETKVAKGDLVLTKTVAAGDDTSKTFTLALQETTKKLSGAYNMSVGGTAGTVTFDNTGYATVTIKHGQTITVQGLPAGVKINVVELAPEGWSASYNDSNVAQQVTITADAAAKAAVHVKNDYHAKPVTFQLKGIKTYVGTNFPANVTFSFQAVQCNPNGSALTGATPIAVYAETVSPNGELKFSPRVFREAFGDRYYKISESPSSVPGMITDGSEYLLHLNVTDDGKGNLVLVYTLSKNGAVVSTNNTTNGVKTGTVVAEGADFTNIYPDSTSIDLGGTKTLTGRYQLPGEFDFQLLVPGNNTVGSSSATVIDTASNVVSSTNGHNGSFSFNTITYSPADMVDSQGRVVMEKEFYYYIREVKGNASFTTYDPAYYVVTVTVKNVNGKLSASKSIVKYENATDDTPDNSVTSIDFGNTFTVQDARLTLTGTKALIGRDLIDGEFSFSAYRSDENGTIGTLASSGVNKGAAINFAPIGFSFDEMGRATSKDFYFVVQEDRPSADGATFDPNMYYDPTAYLVKVTVSYDRSVGTLTPGTPVVVKVNKSGTWETADANATLAFVNIQNPDHVDVKPIGNKLTTGTALPEGLRFSFRVTSDEAGQILAGTGVSQGTNNNTSSNNAIDFTELVISDVMFAAAPKNSDGSATFTYYIRESNTASSNGVTYDTAVFKYEVTVKRDQHNKLVEVENSAKYYKKDASGWTETPILFNNEYDAKGHINLTAAKTTENTYDLNGRDFDFRLQRLTDAGTLVDGSAVNGYNDANGKVTFATLNFSNKMLDSLTKYSDNGDYWLVRYLMGEIKPATGAIPGIDYDPSRYIVTIKLTVNSSATDTINAELVSVCLAENNNGVYKPVDNATDEKAKATGENNTGVTFINIYSVQQGVDVTFGATKELSGRDFVMNETTGLGEFGFALYRYGKDDAGADVWHNIGTAFNDATGKISFTRHYSAYTLSHNAFDSEYRVIYRIDEINGGLGGIDYSDKQYFVEIIIVHDLSTSSYLLKEGYPKYYSQFPTDGVAELDVSAVVFDNEYQTNDAKFLPNAQKKLEGANIGDYNFSFEVVETNANGEIQYNPTTNAAIVWSTGRNNGTETVTFEEMIFNGPKEMAHQGNTTCTEHSGCEYHIHYYLIRENAGTYQGITYDGQCYYFTVEVHDDGKGHLSVINPVYYQYPGENQSIFIDANKIDDAAAIFTNHFGPGFVNLNLQVNKVVAVKYPAANTFALRGTPVIDPNAQYEMTGSEFDFEVYEYDPATQTVVGNMVASGSNDADGKVRFSTITYTHEQMSGAVKNEQTGLYEKKFYYAIKELPFVEGDVPGVTYDAKWILVTVTVTDDGYGNMTATPTYADNDDVANNDTTFINVYQVKDPATVVLTAVKELVGKDMESFTFQLKDENGNLVGEKKNDGSAVTFDPLTFYMPGTYTYTVTEVNEGKAYMTYDATEYTVIIQVWDDREGKLYTVINITDGSQSVDMMVFRNKYEHPKLVIDLSEQIGANKSVTGPNGESLEYLLKKYQFRFEVVDLEDNPVLDADGNPMIGVTDESGKITFPKFVFEHAGERHYLIREQAAYADRRITTDDQIWCAHIRVVYDSADGVLKIHPDGGTTHLYNAATHNAEGISAQVYENPDFINRYDPADVTIQINAKKILEGRPLMNHEFTFRLLDEKGNIAAEAKNHDDGSITFYLDYELADLVDQNGKQVAEKVFTYQMVELIPNTKLGGVKYTNKSVNVSVTVTDNQEGNLLADVEYASKAEFVNTYAAADGIAVIEAVKLMEGISLSDKVFQFQLLDEEGNPVKDSNGAPVVANNDAAGKIRFELPMTKVGVYNYQIAEVKGDIPGVIYDENIYKATVTVTDNLAGALICTTAYENDVIPTFVNVYETDDASVTIKAEKELLGNILKGEDFTFQLKDAEGNVVATAKNDAEGKVRFDFLIEEAGEYTYTISEQAGEDGHVSYDSNSYEVIVEVEDNGEGKLLAKDPVYKTEDGKSPVFTNTYTPDSIKVTVEASKQFSGKDLKGNDFIFQLLDEEGKEVASAKNTVDGKISFQLDIDAEGTYIYTMVEKAGDNAQITYDAAKYKVAVKVVNDNGELKATVTYDTDDEKAPVFQNTWKPEKIGITLTGTKTLTGRDMKAGEFKFQVHDSTGTLVATGTNDAKGKITFTPVGIVTKGTYLLTVSEVQGTAEYVTYDKATFQVKVVVENVDGVLVPTVTYPDGDIAFENSYDEPANPETGDNSPIYWMIGLLVISALAIVLLIVFRPKKGGKYAKK